MYHEPVPLDAHPDAVEADESGGPLALDSAGERLREAHLHNGQVEARAIFAPFFAVTAVLGALVVAWSLLETVRIELVVGWPAKT